MVNNKEDKDAARVDTSSCMKGCAAFDDIVRWGSAPGHKSAPAPEASASTTSQPYMVSRELKYKDVSFICEIPYQIGFVKDIALCRNQLIIACQYGICAWDLDKEIMELLKE